MGKYIRFMFALFWARALNRRVPLLVTLCVTGRCNLRCVYCYADCGAPGRKEFTTQQLLDVIDGLYALGMRYVSLNGGEALLREDIGQIIDHINKKKILCQITTNGLLVEKKIDVLRKVDTVTVSLDGGRVENDRNRGVGVYDHVMKAIKVLKENKVRFQTNMVLTRNNVKDVKEVLSLAQQWDFKVQFNPLRLEDCANKELGLDDAGLKDTINQIMAHKKAGLPVFSSRAVYQQFLDWPYSYVRLAVLGEAGLLKGPPCYLKRLSCQVESDGTVYPCIVLVNKVKALNFLDVGIKKCFEHQESLACHGCWNICCNDLNLLFSLRPHVWGNVLGIIKRRIMG